LRAIRPPADAWTEYVYTNAAGTTPAGLSVKRYPLGSDLSSSSPQVLTDNEYYFDAWGRLIETKAQMPDGWSSIVRNFDAMGRLSSTGTPVSKTTGTYENFTPAHLSSFTYDPFGREQSITQADNSITTLAYTGARQTVRTNSGLALPAGTSPTSATSTETYDRLGRLASVSQQSGATSASSAIGSNVTTSYGYDAADHLISVQSGTQSRAFEYDGRGFLVSETHPEKGVAGNGTTLYQVTDSAGNIDGYDARGHSRRRLDGSVNGGFDLALTYDSAERLIKLEDIDPASTNPKTRRILKEFTFGTANAASNYKQGRVETATRHNYLPGLTGDVVVTETYKYGSSSGRPSARDTLVENVNGATRTTLQSLTKNFTYDQLGATSQVDYPICTTVPCGGLALAGPTFTHKNGFLTGVSSYAPAITYTADGAIFEVNHNASGSIKDTYAPDTSGMMRPGVISFAGVACASAAVSGDQTIATGQAAAIVVAFSGTGPWNITWSDGISQNGITQNPLTRNVSPSVTTIYRITSITDSTSCAGSSSGSATVTVQSCSASATVSGGASITIGQSTQIQASLAGTAPWRITWSDGIQESGINTATWQRTVSPTTTTIYTITSVTDATGCAGTRGGTATVTVAGLPAPTGFLATTVTGNILAVSMSWIFVQGASWYQIERATRITLNDWQAVSAHLTSAAFTDSFGPAANPVTYLYRLRRGITISGTDYLSDPSPLDYATIGTNLFTDEPLNNGITKAAIKGIHLGELRHAIDAVRYAAGYPPAWSSYAAVTGAIYALDNTTARQKLDEAVTFLVNHGVPYSGEVPATNSRIWAYQLQQIRDGVR
jgi:YD repeat-containing protein